MMKNSIFLVIVILLSGTANAQYSVGGGFSTLFQFGNSRPFVGLNLITEFPRNNDQTFYVRANLLFKQTLKLTGAELDKRLIGVSSPLLAYGINSADNPIEVGRSYRSSINYLNIDAGTRYYIINGYDEGFSLYGGTTIGASINSVKWSESVEDYDKSKYVIDDLTLERYNYSGKGTILNMAIGLTGGAKYTLPGRGTFFIDLSPSYMIFGLPTPSITTSSIAFDYSKVIFNFNFGFRKEFY